MSYIRVSQDEVGVGKALPWAVYDAEGILLLRQGYVISSDHQLRLLMERGLYRNSSGDGPAEDGTALLQDNESPFELVREFCYRLSNIFGAVDETQRDFKQRITKLATDIHKLCEMDIDAALGAVHIYDEHPYTIVHPVHQAILCCIVSAQLDYSDADRRSLLCAALTANIAMLELQEQLHKQVDPLTGEQREAIRRHPEQGMQMLIRHGVNDVLWLKIVMQHHERFDGSGYPRGLEGDEVAQQAMLLAVADRYAAMVSSRGYRKPLSAKGALREFFVQKGKEFDESLSLLFIKNLGIFPPGTFVKLVNGETAVVIQRGKRDSMQPVVSSFISPRGGAYATPLRRDCSQKEYAIHESCDLEEKMPLNLHMLWGYI
jgi:HD-GYP domain-containing protein (c-di-GMP phosphodiesterase class II)